MANDQANIRNEVKRHIGTDSDQEGKGQGSEERD